MTSLVLLLLCAGIDDLPEAVSEDMLEDEEFLKKFHHALLEVHLEEGSLVCPETGRHLKRGQGTGRVFGSNGRTQLWVLPPPVAAFSPGVEKRQMLCLAVAASAWNAEITAHPATGIA